jgi:glycerol-3-phosphate dehydrogenase
MKRDPKKLSDEKYDLIIIGGGIAGVFCAWDAALRGLKVALVEKGDFGAATSAASGKIIHGGIRYMQYGAFLRVRQSLRERRVFQKIAPQFVRPIPFLIPTYGHFLKGKEFLRLGMTLYDLLSLDMKHYNDPARIIPPHKVLSRAEVVKQEPGVNRNGLNGGIIYYDCQMHNPERLTLSVLMAAHSAGADISNYTEATGFLRNKNRITGIKAKDVLSGEKFEICGKLVLNAAGPWAGNLLVSLNVLKRPYVRRYSKGIHIVTRSITRKYALALASKHKSAEALIQRGGRHFFIIPWRDYSLIGTTNVRFEGHPDEKMVTEKDIEGLLQEVNAAYPSADLKREDVVFQYGGLYLDDEKQMVENGYQGGRKDQIIDHIHSDGIEGLVTAICVKYTMARSLAKKAVDLVFKKIGYNSPECLTDKKAVYGGDILKFKDYIDREASKNADAFKKEITEHIIYNYGTTHTKLLEYSSEIPDYCTPLHERLPIIKAQVIHAIREEMAMKLGDVVFRRTGLGTIGNPGESSLQNCAHIMADELGWDDSRIQRELNEVKEAFLTACHTCIN